MPISVLLPITIILLNWLTIYTNSCQWKIEVLWMYNPNDPVSDFAGIPRNMTGTWETWQEHEGGQILFYMPLPFQIVNQKLKAGTHWSCAHIQGRYPVMLLDHYRLQFVRVIRSKLGRGIIGGIKGLHVQESTANYIILWLTVVTWLHIEVRRTQS